MTFHIAKCFACWDDYLSLSETRVEGNVYGEVCILQSSHSDRKFKIIVISSLPAFSIYVIGHMGQINTVSFKGTVAFRKNLSTPCLTLNALPPSQRRSRGSTVLLLDLTLAFNQVPRLSWNVLYMTVSIDLGSLPPRLPYAIQIKSKTLLDQVTSQRKLNIGRWMNALVHRIEFVQKMKRIKGNIQTLDLKSNRATYASFVHSPLSSPLVGPMEASLLVVNHWRLKSCWYLPYIPVTGTLLPCKFILNAAALLAMH